MAAVFVVRLPRGDSRMPAKLFREAGYDPNRFCPVTSVRKTVMASGTESLRPSFDIDGEHIGHPVDQPFRRRSRRGAENHRQISLSSQIKDAPQPAEFMQSWPGLEATPGKLPDANEADSKILHGGEVFRPFFCRPVFGIIANPK